MPVSDSGFDNSSKTMKDDTIPTEHYEEITKESEMGDATKITSKVDANVIEKKDTDSENNITIAQDDGKVSWLQRVVEFFEVKNDSTDLSIPGPKIQLGHLKIYTSPSVRRTCTTQICGPWRQKEERGHGSSTFSFGFLGPLTSIHGKSQPLGYS
ncbi:AVN_HP_G0136310.mRNA.1.CDS.1 [Saccharomyces cerevisiae]|nr:AVN_HP_G0136310.mRNA.1.CDS.1 [Saccharomyces cerevisiae]CAI6438895.1 AVN_HP_G0136310.mRNA.1.CDS.1 [Saccharomyces cerevisiae]